MPSRREKRGLLPLRCRRASRPSGVLAAWEVIGRSSTSPCRGPPPLRGKAPRGAPVPAVLPPRGGSRTKRYAGLFENPRPSPGPLRPMAGGPGAVRGLPPGVPVGRTMRGRCGALGPPCAWAQPPPPGVGRPAGFSARPSLGAGAAPPAAPLRRGGARRAAGKPRRPLRSPRAGIVAAGLRRSAGFRWSPLPRSARPPRPCRPAPGPPTPAAGRPLNAPSGAARGRSRRFALAPPSGGRLGAGRKRPALDAAAAPRTKGKGLTY